MKRKKLFQILACSLTVMMLAACGGQPASGAPQSSGESTAPSAAGPDEEITLNMWHIQTNADDLTAKALLDAIDLYEETHPNVKIVQDATQGEQYKVKLRTAAASNELPDIYFAWGYSYGEDFVAANKALDLTPYMDDGTADKIKPGLLSVLSYDGKVYGLPVDFSGMLMFYNKTVFDENGLEIPETYEELQQVVQAFKDKGITPMIMGGKAMWPITALFEDYSIRTVGADKCLDVVSFEDTINQEGFVKAATYMQDFLGDGTLTEDSMILLPPEANTKFAGGGIPITYNGTWSIGVFESDSSSVQGQIVAKPLPLINGELDNPEEYVGASLSGYMVSADTKYPDVAVEAVKFITEQAAKNLYQSGAGLPAWNVEVDESQLNQLIIDVNNMYGTTTKGVANWDTLLPADYVEDYKNTTTMLALGDLTPEEYAQEMESLLAN